MDGEGKLWIVDGENKISYHHNYDQWIQCPGTAVAIAAGPDNSIYVISEPQYNSTNTAKSENCGECHHARKLYSISKGNEA